MTKGPVVISQLVKGKAGPQSRVLVGGVPSCVFTMAVHPAARNRIQQKSPESARGSFQGIEESGCAPWVLRGQFKGQGPGTSQHWALPKSRFHILSQGWSPRPHGDIEPSRLERRARGTLWDC